MAKERGFKYEYETSPRKLKPNYEPKKEVPKKKKSYIDPKKEEKQKKANHKAENRRKLKIVMSLVLGFSLLFAISYRYSLINEEFNNVQKLKKDLSTIQKDNEKLAVNVDNQLNLTSIEQIAKNRLGMQKLDNKQTVYVTLDKQDYVEPAAAQIVQNNQENVFTKIVNTIKGFVK